MPSRWLTALRALALGCLLCAGSLPGRVTAQGTCRMPPDDQWEAGGALEGLILVFHGLWAEPPDLEQGLAYGDPGACPGGTRDGFRVALACPRQQHLVHDPVLAASELA